MIRKATSEDLPRLIKCAEEFYSASKFLRNFNLETFCRVWSHLMDSGIGVVFLFEKDGEPQGALGGMLSADLYSGESYSQELFWFVREGYRGAGLRLYRAFEQWTRENGCKEVRMVNLADSMADKLGRTYGRLGFEIVETHWSKRI